MLLREIYRRLSVGLLSNLAMSNDGSGELTERGQKTALLHLNRALSICAKRFIIREGALILGLEVGRSIYNLRSEHTKSRELSNDPGTGPFYILDTEAEPFTDKVIRPLRVYAANGFEFALNDQDNPQSLFTPAGDKLQFPGDFDTPMVAVSYQAFFDPVLGDNLDFDIEIPAVLEDPILFYIASGVFSDMTGQEHLLKGQSLMAIFENELQLLESNDLLSVSIINFTDKFSHRGFV